MASNKRLFYMVLVAVLAGLALWLHFVWSIESKVSEAVPRPPAHMSSEPPMSIVIHCENGEKSGFTSYGGTDIPEGAVFVGCRPDEDFTYDVSSTEAEVSDSSRRPEIAFVLTGSGEAKDALVTRSSGSNSLDAKVLKLVAGRHYRPTRCGTCRIVVAVPVDLKRR